MPEICQDKQPRPTNPLGEIQGHSIDRHSHSSAATDHLIDFEFLEDHNSSDIQDQFVYGPLLI